MERWPDDIPVSVCTLGINGGQSRAHCAAALMYAMRMPTLKTSLRHCNAGYRMDGGRCVNADNTYSGFRRFEIARVEQVALQLSNEHIDAIFAQADEVCKLNSNSVNNDGEQSGQT